MRKPQDSTCYRPGKAFQFYFNIEDSNRPLFTPTMFYWKNQPCYIEYNQDYSNRGHKNYPNLLNSFYGYNAYLEQFRIKDRKYMAGNGMICRHEHTEEHVDNIYPIAILCFDENTDWDNRKKFKLILNTSELDHSLNKVIRPKLIKIAGLYITNYQSDVIYTNDVMKWCFNQAPNLKFRSIKEQRDFLTKLVEETV